MSTSSGTADQLQAAWADVAALGGAAAVLSWDQETMMPPEGQPARGRTMARLAGMHHERLTGPELGDAIDAALADAADGSDLAAQARQAKRERDRALAVPVELARRQAEVTSRAQVAWQRARAEDDFSVFRNELAESLEVAIEVADAYVAAGLADARYDALLDIYEPGTTEADIAPLFASLREELVPIVAAVADSGVVVDNSPVRGEFATAAQEALVREVAQALGYDFARGRLDLSAHPFSTSFGVDDVRITWRADSDDMRMGLYGTMHETGHALYELGIPAEWDGTPIGGGASLGVHESQSRLWENLVGRRRSTIDWLLPRYHAAFPAKADVDADALWRALNVVEPSLIRVEADETTYNLHIMVRFELERALLGGDLGVDELPDAWADTYADVLGVRPPSVADGVLQDIHWSMGAFGYFPTYTLGNLLASQLFDAAAAELGDLDALFAAGDFAPLLGWLHTNVHRHGAKVPVPELIENATGAPLAADSLVRHLRTRVSAVYGLDL